MSEKERAIQALRHMIEQNEARGQKEGKLKDWFNGLNKDLWKAIETLQRA